VSSQTGNPPSQADLERQMLDVERLLAIRKIGRHIGIEGGYTRTSMNSIVLWRTSIWLCGSSRMMPVLTPDADISGRSPGRDRRQSPITKRRCSSTRRTNADAYRDMIRKAQGGENANTTTSAASTPKPQATPAPASGLTGFFKRLAQYYAEFLSTDFKKQRLPRRRLQNADAQGRLVGIPLRKYPGFQQKLWADLAKPVGAGLSLTVARRSWRKAVVEAIATHIAMVRQEDLAAVVTTVMGKVARTAERKSSDPDIAFEQFVEGVRSTLAKSVIGPLLDRMEGFFERTEHKPIESLRNLTTSSRRGSSTVSRAHPVPLFQGCLSSMTRGRSKPFCTTN
jgi:hypothetical protein